MTHTPGPWIMDAPEIVSGRVVIATIHDTPPINTAQSNARLIAAAPDMLEALRSANKWMSCVNPALMDGKPFKLDRERIRAAIAKATDDAQ